MSPLTSRATDSGSIQHLLGRAGIGPRAGEVSAIARLGAAAWIEQQLKPPPGDDPATAELIATASLPIKYPAGDPTKQQNWSAVDETRPLEMLGRPIETIWPLLDNHATPPQERRRAVLEVISATLIRWAHSDYPVREVLVEFWHDHFNVDAWDQDQVALALPSYDRDVIRPNCLGNFRVFLESVATSTAMLYYLSNRSSRAGSANENYARELFELHTLGAPAYLNDKYDRWREVPGALSGHPTGYIDQDVYESARAFTGWTVEDGSSIDGGRKLPATGRFAYVESWHDGYQKRVLATEFDAFQPALADGRRVLDLVAYHPATARFICAKLVRRLVSDVPPAALVERAAATWTAHRDAPDQIARVVAMILTSPEFAASRGQKVRRPLALVAAFARATGIPLRPTEPLINGLSAAGQRLYGFPTPNGLPDSAPSFLGTSAMRQRWALLLAVADNAWNTGDYPRRDEDEARTPAQAASYWLKSFGASANPDDVAAVVQAIGVPADMPLGPDKKYRARAAAFAAMAPAFQSC